MAGVSQIFPSYPSYILFDGNLGTEYGEKSLAKIAMLSSSFRKYAVWDGDGAIPAKEKKLLINEINRAHALHKTVRYWEAPDATDAWYELMHLNVDYINTDHINQLAEFFKYH